MATSPPILIWQPGGGTGGGGGSTNRPGSLGSIFYFPNVVAILTADGTPSLQGLATTSYAVGTLIVIVIDGGAGPEEQTWRLEEITDAFSSIDPGVVTPDDFDSVSNNKHFRKVL